MREVKLVRVCSLCKKEYPNTEEFFHYKDGKRIRLKCWCKSCANERSKQYRKKHPEKIYELRKKWQMANPEKKKLSDHLYYKNNKEKHQQDSKKWKADHPEKLREYNLRRRTIKAGLPFEITQEDRQQIYTYWKGNCAVCGRPLRDPLGRWEPSLDHWIPLSSKECPGTIKTNIVPLCNGLTGCNTSKNSSDPMKWLIFKFGEEKAQQINNTIQEYFKCIGDAPRYEFS